MLASMIRRILLQVGVNLALVIAIFFTGAFFAGRLSIWMQDWISDPSWQKALIWGGALLLSLPFLIAAYRKLKALVLIAVVAAAVAALLWRWFIRVHTRMQVALLETLDNHKESSGH
jgi:CPA2 family monovalent cation:H+ antiporter-2